MELTNYQSLLKTEHMPPNRKEIRKLGTLHYGTVETTPVVWKDRLLLLEWLRPNTYGKGHDERKQGYFRFYDLYADQEVGIPFAFDHAFGCAFEENGVMYAAGVRRIPNDESQNRIVDIYASSDLCHWEEHIAIMLPEGLHEAFNTSICRGKDGYVMVIEVNGSRETAGKGFSVIFATSKDLIHWELMPYERYMFFKERYTACPTIRYYDGFYYIVYLEMLPLFRLMPYIIRTADFEVFEPGFYNPFMRFDNDDKKVAFPDRMTPEEIDFIQNAVNINASDVDFCDFNGKSVIVYSWGNQLGTEFLALAEYDGTVEEMLRSCFIDKE